MSAHPITTAELEALHARGLPNREFQREVFAIERGADALRMRDLQVRRDQAADLYRQSLDAYRKRLHDGSLQPYQLRTLTQAFTSWRAAVEALAEHQSRRRMPAAAE